MSNKIALAIVVVAIVVGFFLLRSPNISGPGTTSTTASSTSQKATSTQPSITVGVPVKVLPVSAAFNSNSLISTSSYPTVSGTANVSQVGIIVNNDRGVGIVGTANVPVTGGHWIYHCSVALAPGTYTVSLYANGVIKAIAELVVNKS
jgi:hypothetical protein